MTKVLLLTLASALVAAQQPEFIHQQQLNEPSPIDPTISYNYGYEINDEGTGNVQNHQEALDNGVLRGSYSVVQPDGNRRIVEYEADEVSGFQARVRYEPGYPIQGPTQPKPSGEAAVSQGSIFSSGSPSRRLRPSQPSQGAQNTRDAQSSTFVGGAAQPSRYPIRSQSLQWLHHEPTRQGPAEFIGGSPPRTSQLQGSIGQGSPTGLTGVSPLQGSQFVPHRFPGAQSGSQFIVGSRPTATLNQGPVLPQPAGVGLTSIINQHGSAQGSTVSSQNTFSSGVSETGQSGVKFGGPPSPGVPTQGISAGSRLQVGPSPSVLRPIAPVAPRPVASGPPSFRPLVPAVPQSADVAVHIASSEFFTPPGAGSSSGSASHSSAGGATHASVSGDSSSSIFQSGASSSAFPAGNAASNFQYGPGSRFAIQRGPGFDKLISSSLLVTNENLDSIDAVELASAGFDDSAYAYRLVPVPVNN